MRIEMGIVEILAGKAFQKALLIQKQLVARHTYHLRLKLASGFANYVPGQQLRVFVWLDNPLYFNNLVRTYSVWHYDPATLEVDLAVCIFSKGKGAAWAEKIQAGDVVHFSGPKGKFVWDHSAQQYILLGDISALGPLYELARQVKPDQSFLGLVYSSDEADFFTDIFDKLSFGFVKATENPSQAIISELDGVHLSGEKTIAYVAGEAAFCKDLTDYFRKVLYWNPRQVKAKPFWQPGRKGLE